MARLLAVLLLVSSVPIFTEAAVKAGLCPRAQPSGSSSSCTDDSGCPNTQKCCNYNNNRKCVAPVIPNYMARFYITGLPQVNNEMQSLNNYVEHTFRDLGTMGDLVIERFGTCVRVFLNLQTENEAEVDLTMANLENNPVHIVGFTGGPFKIVSQKSDTLCPEAMPNFSARVYILGVNGTSTPGQAKAVLSGLIGNKGKGWEYSNQQIGGCMEIFMEAKLNQTEETAVLQVLTNIEENGITLNESSKTGSLNVTSNSGEAASCYENYYQNGCKRGERLCPNINYCISERAFCDGKDDCGDFSDELACKCPNGTRACANDDVCLNEMKFCDGANDCSDGSDEEDCYFESYTINITAKVSWNAAFHNEGSSFYTQMKGAVETYLTQAFHTVANYSSAHVITFRQTADHWTSVAVTLKFMGQMDATTVLRKQKDILPTGIVSGFINIPLISIVPVKSGPCMNHECGTGLCIESNDQAHCRCRLGQDPLACAPIDCRGQENYCNSNDTKACTFIPHHSGHACKCPVGYSGTHCEVDVCSKLGSMVCGASGQCIGDLYNFTLCTCDDFFQGAFCDDRGNDMLHTTCQKQWELHTRFLKHLDGSGELVNSDFLNGNTLPQQLEALGYTQLEVPTCYDDNSANHGYYHHICIYSIANISAGSICYCTNGNGTYNGTDYVDGECRKPDNFDPEEKPGRCPKSADSIRFECMKDSECGGDMKCCRYGAGRQCKVPLTEPIQFTNKGSAHGHDRYSKTTYNRYKNRIAENRHRQNGLKDNRYKIKDKDLPQRRHRVSLIPWRPKRDVHRHQFHRYDTFSPLQSIHMIPPEDRREEERSVAEARDAEEGRGHRRALPITEPLPGLPPRGKEHGERPSLSGRRHPAGSPSDRDSSVLIDKLLKEAGLSSWDDVFEDHRPPPPKAEDKLVASFAVTGQKPDVDLGPVLEAESALEAFDAGLLRDAPGHRHKRAIPREWLRGGGSRGGGGGRGSGNDGGGKGGVKPAECPDPKAAVTARVCESDGDCPARQKCCSEGHGQLCREPLYVTRFQIKMTMNAEWNDRFYNFADPDMESLHSRLVGMFSDLKGFRNVTFLQAEPGSLKLTFEVVASPEVTLEQVEQKATSLQGQTFMFDRMNRFVNNASLVTHNFCGSLGCGTGTCVNSTRGAKCLCLHGVFGHRCQFADPCKAGVCENGGTCDSTSNVTVSGETVYQFTCRCPPGFMGATCEVVVCNELPTGLCNTGTCVGNLNGGTLCHCPFDKRGIFCQDNGTEISYSECELRERLDNYLAQVLRGETTIHTGMGATGLQALLTTLGMEWLPLFTCEHRGDYSLTAELLSVADRNTLRYICLDTSGREEVNCETKVCKAVGSICQNNAPCVGNINLQLCDCQGTGHHGAMCNQAGEDDVTECELKHGLAQLTLDALGGNLEVPGKSKQEVRGAITTLLSDIHRDVVWQPDCTKGGSHAYRGCEFQVPGTSSKTCFCVNDKHERLADSPSSNSALPECPMAGACSEFTTDPCGEHGRCIGDLNAGSICECETGYYGIMCRSTIAASLTDCQRRNKLANYLLNIMHGYLEKPIELSGTVQQLLETADISRLEVPACGDSGQYRHICTYTTDTAEIDECRCTNDDGTYRMNTDGEYCQNIAKPGECPSLPSGTMGITIQECSADKDCNASTKCCSIGSGHQCRDPVLVSVFRVNVTINAASNLMSGIESRIKPQMEDVFRALPGYRSVNVIGATSAASNKINVIVEVKASVDVTAADISNALNRMMAAEFTLSSATQLYTVFNATLSPHGACTGEDCGSGMCVDTSYGARCVCPEGTTGDMCQYISPSCNCSLGQQCLRGAHPEILACACYPADDATCKLPLWYCEGKADCQTTEKCVHEADCDSCEASSRCLPLTQTHTCDSQPCQHGGMCIAKPGGIFVCRCAPGFGGSRCERNEDICKVVPSSACTQGCVGDIHVGVLCKCPAGRAGINCDLPGHSRCEQKRALFSDLVKIYRSQLKVPGVTQTQLFIMLTRLMEKIEVDSLPLTNCTADGGFAPVQCQLHLASGNQTCHCVDRNHGKPISSNVMAYPGFPPCTAPYSPEVTGEMLCSTTLSTVCRNGGTCVGNLLNGTMCQCSSAYQGIFCQDRASTTEQPAAPRSVCEFSLEVWKLMSKTLTSGDRSLMTQLQYLQDHLFHASLNMPNQMIKAACTPMGTFEPVQCVYNLRSDQAGDCFCIHPKGVILSSRARWPQQPNCQALDPCLERACNLTTSCEHGLATDRHGCEVCRCRHACDGACEHDPGKRCVVETQDNCGRENWEGACTSGVCRPRQKVGTCPASVSANMTELTILRSPSQIGSCHVTCLDDADCPDNLKCCGVCGSRCVIPEEDNCHAHDVNANQEFEFLKELQDSLVKGQIDMTHASRIMVVRLEAIKIMKHTWVPACAEDGSYNLTQCATKFTNKTHDAICFCVDRHGNRIPGTNAETRDETNCEAKPGKCPFLQPNASAIHNCLNDYDCHDNTKCCSHGLGSQCVEPHEEEQGDAISLDLVVNSLCSFAGDLCGLNGACVNRWFTQGRVCECNSGYHGVFCEQTGSAPGGQTPCKRRKAMKDYLLTKALILRQILTRGSQMYGHNRPFKYTDPECLPDGVFAPAQCNYNLDTKQKLDCFCVNKGGQPLQGTNVPGDQSPACARPNPCDVGAPLHHVSNGSAVMCGGKIGNCVPGYACLAGRYGELYCCRSRTGNLDTCQLPPNPGPDCQYFEDGSREVTQQRFYYDGRAKQCRAFTYKGCAKSKPNFSSKAACETRCVRKEHEGRCPAKTVVAPRASCIDSCQGDSTCPEESKCCNTTCGRHCILALNNGGALCEIGEPLMDPVLNQPKPCSTDQDCGPAYRCRQARCCQRRSENLCTLPQLHGPCEAYKTRYYFNPESKQCETFVYGGCGGNDNNFITKADCCKLCGEGRCKEGTCPAPRPVLSVSCDHSCNGDGGCPSDQICCNSSCGGSACVIPKPSASSQAGLSCVDLLGDYRQQMARAKGCFLQHKPRCDNKGQWERQQCNDKLGVCWCVSPNGFVVPGTRVRGTARCQWVTPAMMLEADERGVDSETGDQCQVCPGGEPVHCCNEDLCRQVCPADPGAVCRIEPCGGCRAVFYNSDNRIVDCTKGLSTCQLRRHQGMMAGSKQRIVSLAAESRRRKMPPFVKIAGTDKGQVPYVVTGIPYKCQLPPDTGHCLAHSAKWFYNVSSQSCEVFVYGLCGGNDNRFHTPEDCYAECHAAASPCHKKSCGSSKTCRLKYRSNCFAGNCGLSTECRDQLPDYKVRGAFVPDCTGSGDFRFRQCHAGLCWCVKPDGKYNQGITTDMANLKCSSAGPIKRGRTSVACPGGAPPKLDCLNMCDDATCPGYPDAVCVIDLCTCETSFVGSNGRTVTCKGDKCQVDVFSRATLTCSNQQVCQGRGPKGCEYRDLCKSTLCPANPCAVCLHDPCTGQAVFQDKLTGAVIRKEDCNRVTHTNCELRKCEVQTLNARAAYGETLLVEPACMEDGSYNPQQRRADNTVFCVNDFGEAVPTPPSGNCVRDALVSMSVAVTYEGDYDTIVPSRNGKIKQAFVDVMKNIGLTPGMINGVKITKGSIVITTNIVNHPSSKMDFAVVKPLIQSKAMAGELTLRVDGFVLRVAGGAGGGVMVMPTTASMVQQGPAQGGLGPGGVAGVVIVVLLLLGAAGGGAFYFLYYRKRLEGNENGQTPGINCLPSKKRMEGEDNRGFDMPGDRHGKKTVNDPDFVEHSMDDHYVKVKI